VFTAGITRYRLEIRGITELIEHDINGLLVEAVSVSEWKRTFERALNEDMLYLNLKVGVHQPRTMSDVALEMSSIYNLLGK